MAENSGPFILCNADWTIERPPFAMLQLDGVDHLDIEGAEEMHLCRTIQLMCDALGARCVANALYVHRYQN